MLHKRTLWTLVILATVVGGGAPVRADDSPAVDSPKSSDKIALEDPKQAPATQPVNFVEQLRSLPDGVLRVQTNSDGSFKSLVVKATVEIEEVLGAEKGVRLARKEAEIQAKRSLSQWLSENCVFAEAESKTVTIVTKGDATKDAAGNSVTIRDQKATEVKIATEGYAAYSAASLRGLIVLQNEITKAPSRYILILGLSQKTMNQAIATKAALANTEGTAGDSVKGGESSAHSVTGNDTPSPEVRTNPDVDDFLK